LVFHRGEAACGIGRVLKALVPNMALQRTHRPRFLKVQFGVGADVPVQQHAGTGRSLRSLGAPLNARPLGGPLYTARAQRIALVLLLMPACSLGQSKTQTPAPSGTHWKRIPELKAKLALPHGWQFRKVPSESRTLVYEVVPKGPGMPRRSRSKYQLKVEKGVPSAIVLFKARNFIEAIRAQAAESEEVDEQARGVTTLFSSIAHLDPDDSGVPQLTVALAAIANSRTGTLYTIRFDIPATELEAVEPLANQLFRHITIDDEL
jgi:hypothetical protein